MCLDATAEVRFVDIAAQAGIDFVHYTGASGRKYLPETMGAGLAFLDYDADGDLDLYLTNFGADQPDQLFQNDGRGRFADHDHAR